MIKSTRFLFTIKLTFLLAFFLTTLSQLVLMFITNLTYFLEETFLSSLNIILNNTIFNIILTILRALGIFLLVGCFIGILIIFYYDVIKEQKLI